MRGHKLTPTCVVLSPDDTTAFSGSKDNSILRWDVETGKRVTMLPHWRKLPGGKTPAVKAHSKEVSQEGSRVTPEHVTMIAEARTVTRQLDATEVRCTKLYLHGGASFAFGDWISFTHCIQTPYHEFHRCLPLRLAATAGTWRRGGEIASSTCGIAAPTPSSRLSAGIKTRCLPWRSGRTALRSFPGPTIDVSRCER